MSNKPGQLQASRMTAIDFFDDLSSKYARRRFFGIFVVLSALCFLLGFVVQGQEFSQFTREFFNSTLVELFAGSVIVLTFYSTYVYFIGSKSSEINAIRSQDISEKIKELPKDAREYLFWGRSGGFFRDYPLTKLAEQASENKRVIRVDVLVPDPNDERLVDSYREILRSLGESPSDNPLMPNVLATCIACAILESNNKFLQVTIHLSRYLPAFRLDLSDKAGILTQDDKKKSALYFESSSEFYDMFHSTMINERDMSEQVIWNSEEFRGLELDETSCSAAKLKAFGIDFPESTGIEPEVAKLIKDRPHRYK